MKKEIEQYLEYLTLRNVSHNTIRAYRGNLLDFSRQRGDIEVSRLSCEDVEQFLVELKERQLSKNSVARALTAVKRFCSWMTDEGLLQQDPADIFQGPRCPGQRVQRSATEEEIRQLIDGPIRSWCPERDRLILELFYGSGMRCDEVANIRVGDFAEPDVLLVTRGKGDKERRVLLTDYAQRALELYLKKREQILRRRAKKGDRCEVTGLFFGLKGGQIDALTSKSIFRIVVKLAQDAGLPWLSPHDLRRSFATHMDQHGAPRVVISRLLGHSKTSTTDRYIVAASPSRLTSSYNKARRGV